MNTSLDLLLLASSDREQEGFSQRRIRENPTHFRSGTVKSKRSIAACSSQFFPKVRDKSMAAGIMIFESLPNMTSISLYTTMTSKNGAHQSSGSVKHARHVADASALPHLVHFSRFLLQQSLHTQQSPH